jgi:hypothetical protein
MKKKGPTPKGFYLFMVENFLKGKGNHLTSAGWARETKIAKKIFNLYPNVYLWHQIDLGFLLNSLAYFLTPEGKYTLITQRKGIAFRLKKIKSYKLSRRKIGKDKKIVRTKKTLMDFLNEQKKN